MATDGDAIGWLHVDRYLPQGHASALVYLAPSTDVSSEPHNARQVGATRRNNQDVLKAAPLSA